MAIRVAINGFGRIGRLVFRVLSQRAKEFEVVAVNDLTDNKMLANLLKYDSTHRRFDGTVDFDDKHLIVNASRSRRSPNATRASCPGAISASTSPSRAPASSPPGRPADKPGYDSHLKAGAKRVVISAPAKDGADLTCRAGA